MAAESDMSPERGSAASRSYPEWLVRTWPIWLTMSVAVLCFGIATLICPQIPLASDALGYTRSAWTLVTEGFLSYGGQAPDAFVTPVYPLFLSAFYWFVRDSQSVLDAVRAMHPAILATQFLLAVATVGLISECGIVIGGTFLGLTAGLLAAVYLPFAWASTMALSETVGVLLLVLQLLLALRLVREDRHPTTAAVLSFGAVTGLVALTRPAFVLWAIVPMVWLVVRRRASFAKLATWSVLAALGFVLVMTPWWVRNVRVLDRFIPLSSSQGEARLAAAGGYPLTAEEQQLKDSTIAAGGDGAGAVADLRMQEKLASDPVEVIAARTRGAVASVVLPFVAPNTYYYLESAGLIDDEHRIDFGPRVSSAPQPLESASHVTHVQHWLMLAAAALGLVFARRWPSLWLVATVPVYAVLVHSTILFIPRYFFPAMPAVILMAAAGVYGSIQAVRARRQAESGAPEAVGSAEMVGG